VLRWCCLTPGRIFTVRRLAADGADAPPLKPGVTEQGVAMLSSVLRSERAVRVNIDIMRAFVQLRRMLATHVELAHRLEELERKYDAQFRVVFEAIRELMTPPEPKKKRPIGFGPWEKEQ
jgi:hypothetical protein